MASKCLNSVINLTWWKTSLKLLIPVFNPTFANYNHTFLPLDNPELPQLNVTRQLHKKEVPPADEMQYLVGLLPLTLSDLDIVTVTGTIDSDTSTAHSH